MQSFLVRASAILVSSIVLAVGSARATSIEYVFTPDVSMTLGGQTEAISGSFFFDASTGKQSDVNITLAGAAPYAGLYQLVDPGVSYTGGTYTGIDAYGGGCNSGGHLVGGCGSGGDAVNFYFLGALTVGGVDPIVAVPSTIAYSFQYPQNDSFWCGLPPFTSCSPVAPATAVSGGVEAVPEPTSLALVAAGLASLAGLGFLRRRKQLGAYVVA